MGTTSLPSRARAPAAAATATACCASRGPQRSVHPAQHLRPPRARTREDLGEAVDGGLEQAGRGGAHRQHRQADAAGQEVLVVAGIAAYSLWRARREPAVRAQMAGGLPGGAPAEPVSSAGDVETGKAEAAAA